MLGQVLKVEEEFEAVLNVESSPSVLTTQGTIIVRLRGAVSSLFCTKMLGACGATTSLLGSYLFPVRFHPNSSLFAAGVRLVIRLSPHPDAVSVCPIVGSRLFRIVSFAATLSDTITIGQIMVLGVDFPACGSLQETLGAILCSLSARRFFTEAEARLLCGGSLGPPFAVYPLPIGGSILALLLEQAISVGLIVGALRSVLSFSVSMVLAASLCTQTQPVTLSAPLRLRPTHRLPALAQPLSRRGRSHGFHLR